LNFPPQPGIVLPFENPPSVVGAIISFVHEVPTGFEESCGCLHFDYVETNPASTHVLCLFDMDNDPYQLNNLVGKPEHLALQEEMAERLKKELIKIGDHPFKSEEHYDIHKERSTGISRK